MTNQVRQNFHDDCETRINKQINMELNAMYVYMSMSNYFDRDDVALPGFSKYFKEQSSEEHEHAEKLMKYQNARGGRVVLEAITAPELRELKTGLDALQIALALEKDVNASLLEMHKTASRVEDAHLTKVLEDEFLEVQVKSIKELGDMITRLKRAGPTGLGEYIFDKDLH